MVTPYKTPSYSNSGYASQNYPTASVYFSGSPSDPYYSDIGYASQDYWDGRRRPVEPVVIETGDGEYIIEDRRGGQDFSQAHQPAPYEAPSMENNFGFASFPDAFRAMSIIPGVNPVANMVKAGFSMHNLGSINKARAALGLDAVNPVTGFINANTGIVATVNIGDQTYTVAMNPNPEDPKQISINEAVTLSAETLNEITEATPEQTKAREAEMTQLGTTPSAGTVGSAISNIAGTVTGGLIGTDPNRVVTPAERVTPTPSLEAQNRQLASYNEQFNNPAAPTQVASLDPSNIGIDAGISMASQPSIDGVGLANPASLAAATPGVGPLGGVVQVGQRDASSIPGIRDRTAVQNVAAEARGTIVGATPTGRGRYAAPDQNVTQQFANIVSDTLGDQYGVSLTSGTYSPEHAAQVEAARARATQEAKDMGLSAQATKAHVGRAVSAVGGVGTHRHSTALAGDYTVVDKETGAVVTNRDQLEAVANAAVAQGLSVGFGVDPSSGNRSYMGGLALHVDDTQPSAPNTWGGYTFSREAKEAAADVAQQRATMASYSGIGVPGTREAALADLANQSEDLGLAGYSADNMNPGYTPGTAISPAGFTAMGMGYQYGPQDQTAMAATLAGELSPGTLHGIAIGDPDAYAEAAAVLGTIDNRAMSARAQKRAENVPGYQGVLSGVLTPDQYDALDSTTDDLGRSNLNTTLSNFDQYQQALEDVVSSYTQGLVTSPVPDATHYANLDISNPSWAPSMENAVQVGDHTFGTPDQSWADVQNSYGLAFGPAAAVGIGQESLSGLGMATPSDPDSANALGGMTGLAGGFVSNDSLSGLGTSGMIAASDVSASERGATAASTADAADSTSDAAGDSGNSDGGSDGGSSGGDGGGRGEGQSAGGLGGRSGDNDNDGRGT